jgi:hypothetical protein
MAYTNVVCPYSIFPSIPTDINGNVSPELNMSWSVDADVPSEERCTGIIKYVFVRAQLKCDGTQ